MSIASLSASLPASLSIGRVNPVTPVRPRIAQERTEESRLEVSKLERSRPESPKPDSTKPEPSPTNKVSPPEALRSAERTRLRTRQSEEGSLTLTTDEGDQVTISFRNQQNTRVDQTRLYGPNGSFESTKTRSRESSKLSVSLEGELSEAELKDITDLVNKLSVGIEGTRDGNFSTAQQALASTPEDLGTLQSYSFSYQQSSEIDYKSTLISLTA